MAFAVAAGTFFIPDPAEAGWALFRSRWKTYGAMPTTDPIYTWFTSMPTKFDPSATAYVGPTASARKITLPVGFSSWVGSYYCSPKACWEGYPISGGLYSYINNWGRYGPNNPHGAYVTTTIRFPTTLMSTSGMYTTNGPFYPPGGHFYPDGAGGPTPSAVTTTYSGRYDFDRGGSIQVLPGPNRYGGTMRYIFGPNNTFYQLITYHTPFISTATGEIQFATPNEPDIIGEQRWTNIQRRRRVTPTTVSTTTTITPMGGTSTHMHYTFTPITEDGEYAYSGVGRYLSTGVPPTTGTLIGWAPVGTYQTLWTVNGYDNRTTPNGLSGNLSMVSARLRHTYFKDNQGSPIDTIYNSVRMYENIIKFGGDAPEPGVMLLLGVGVVTLAGLSYVRRR
jgi:hypothetical protein